LGIVIDVRAAGAYAPRISLCKMLPRKMKMRSRVSGVETFKEHPTKMTPVWLWPTDLSIFICLFVCFSPLSWLAAWPAEPLPPKIPQSLV